MSSSVLKVEDMNPDDVQIRVRWDNMDVGSSVFIPCVDTKKAGLQARKIAKGRQWKLSIRSAIENQLLGVRIWRTA